MERKVYVDPVGNAVPHGRSESYSTEGSYTYSDSEEVDHSSHKSNNIAPVPVPVPILQKKATLEKEVSKEPNASTELTNLSPEGVKEQSNVYNESSFNAMNDNDHKYGKHEESSYSNGVVKMQNNGQNEYNSHDQATELKLISANNLGTSGNEQIQNANGRPFVRYNDYAHEERQAHTHNHHHQQQQQLQQMQQQQGNQRPGEQMRNKPRGNATKNILHSIFPFMPNVANKLKKVKTPFGQRITIYALAVIAFVEFIFYILATTLSQLDEINNACYTYWGFKQNCGTVSYTIRTALMYECPSMRSNLQAGAAFSILTILSSTFTLVVTWLMCCMLPAEPHSIQHKIRYLNVDGLIERHQEQSRENAEDNSTNAVPSAADTADARTQALRLNKLKKAALIAMSVTLVFELISWAVIVGVYERRLCEKKDLPRQRTYGAGFGIGLTAWLIELLSMAVFVLLVEDWLEELS